MTKIPTAEEVWNDYHFNYKGRENTLLEAMRHFAKLHVKAALEAASKDAACEMVGWNEGELYSVDKASILNAYPESNIK